MKKSITLIISFLLALIFLSSCSSSEINYVSEGKTYQTEEKIYEILSYGFTNSFEEYSASDGEIFAVVKFSVKNDVASIITLETEDFYLKANGRTYTAKYMFAENSEGETKQLSQFNIEYNTTKNIYYIVELTENGDAKYDAYLCGSSIQEIMREGIK